MCVDTSAVAEYDYIIMYYHSRCKAKCVFCDNVTIERVQSQDRNNIMCNSMLHFERSMAAILTNKTTLC